MIHIIEVVKATFFVDNAADLRGSDCSYELFERARCASHSFTQSDPIKYAQARVLSLHVRPNFVIT